MSATMQITQVRPCTLNTAWLRCTHTSSGCSVAHGRRHCIRPSDQQRTDTCCDVSGELVPDSWSSNKSRKRVVHPGGGWLGIGRGKLGSPEALTLGSRSGSMPAAVAIAPAVAVSALR